MAKCKNGSHWEGCWRVHHDCAVAKIEQMQEDIANAHCHCCGSIDGVYYDLCDDCMTKLNKLLAKK